MFPKTNNVRAATPVVASVHRLPAVARPQGPYMTARQIVDEFFPGTGISPEWVTRTCLVGSSSLTGPLSGRRCRRASPTPWFGVEEAA